MDDNQQVLYAIESLKESLHSDVYGLGHTLGDVEMQSLLALIFSIGAFVLSALVLWKVW